MSASVFKSYPAGAPMPDSVHAVTSSLPTMEAVIGYEEKHPALMAKLRQGYPRFLRHHWVKRLADEVGRVLELEGEVLVPVCSPHAARQLCAYVESPEKVLEYDGVCYARVPENNEVAKAAHAFLQHTGFFVSSREAEDALLRMGSLDKPYEEVSYAGEAFSFIEKELRQCAPETGKLWLTRSGMSAGYAALQGAARLQAKAGRKVWVQLGWLYLDTQRIMEHLLPEGTHAIKVLNVFDLESLKKELDALGDTFAGLVTEVPTNPLVQVADIEQVASLVHARGGLTVFDPSLISLVNLNAFPHADIQLVSLTKYAGWNADVAAGVLMLNRDCPMHDALEEFIAPYVESPYKRCLSRLAWEMQDWRAQVEAMNANAMRLALWLEKHPNVRRVCWAYDKESRAQTLRLTRSEAKPGAVLTLELKKPLADFYDPSYIAKGPSFGTHFSMMCPFMYLAHYDLVSCKEGRASLLKRGIDPDLVRLSCGGEPFIELQKELERLLG